MATHSSVLAWRIPGTGEPGGQQQPRTCRLNWELLPWLPLVGLGLGPRQGIRPAPCCVIGGVAISRSLLEVQNCRPICLQICICSRFSGDSRTLSSWRGTGSSFYEMLPVVQVQCQVFTHAISVQPHSLSAVTPPPTNKEITHHLFNKSLLSAQ